METTRRNFICSSIAASISIPAFGLSELSDAAESHQNSLTYEGLETLENNQLRKNPKFVRKLVSYFKNNEFLKDIGIQPVSIVKYNQELNDSGKSAAYYLKAVAGNESFNLWIDRAYVERDSSIYLEDIEKHIINVLISSATMKSDVYGFRDRGPFLSDGLGGMGNIISAHYKVSATCKRERSVVYCNAYNYRLLSVRKIKLLKKHDINIRCNENIDNDSLLLCNCGESSSLDHGYIFMPWYIGDDGKLLYHGEIVDEKRFCLINIL